MCNACGFLCCAWDGFEGCGCDCEEMACWAKCEFCGEYEASCNCADDAIEDEDER
jgi:hypothetical protein